MPAQALRVGGQHIDGIEDRLRYAARFIHQDKRGSARESPGMPIDHDPPACDQRRRVPFRRVPCTTRHRTRYSREIPLAMSLADVAPQDRVNLLRRGSCCGGEWVFSRIEPSRDCPRDTAALAGVMRALISSILTANHLLGLRHPLQSSDLDDSSGRLVSRSRERCTRVRPAMRSSVMVGTCDSSSSEVRTIGCGPPDRRGGCPQCSFRSQTGPALQEGRFGDASRCAELVQAAPRA